MPSFVQAEMDQLYQSLFSSLIQFAVYGAIDNANTYVVRENGRIVSLLLFRIENGKAHVINEVMRIDEAEIARFANFVFARFALVGVILFKAIDTNARRLLFPFQRVNHLEDIVLTLPRTVEEYMTSLGKATRKTIKGYMNKLRRDYPSFTYRIYRHDELDEYQIREIIRFNWARMAEKHKVSAYDEKETQRIIALAKACGLVGVATIDGHICGGAVSYRIGDNFFMSINAHDPLYDNYRLGTLCSFLIISECITQGGRECHLLWGRHEYKYRFLGVQRDLDNLAVYRSRMELLRHADTAIGLAHAGLIRQLRLLAHQFKPLRHGFFSYAANGWHGFLRKVKRFGGFLSTSWK
ncbi:MAG TPA: GNAT family N-acetyltransferase [Burkholderiaceae bacterium]|nr:GNAT family N-acetyltransferase [Burkholderiaceae bacterium]